MTDNPKMVDLPWHDGTTRTVPEGTPFETKAGTVYAARDGGYSNIIHSKEGYAFWVESHRPITAAVRIFTEAPEPPVKVDVPTGIGAIVSSAVFPDNPGFVLTRDGWRGLHTYTECHPSEIADRLRDGARVLYEGVDE